MGKLINCIILDDEPIAREILELYVQKTPELKLISITKNVREAIDVISKNSVDLIFLDIQMPEISGITFAKIIDKNVKIIFTTAHREYAVEGFEIQAIDYLLKPFSYERFNLAVNKYSKSYSSIESEETTSPVEIQNNSFTFIRSERKMIKVNFKDIILIESLSDYIKIYLTDKTLVTRETISNMGIKLPSSTFIRIHRSFIVPIDKIKSYTNEHVEIDKRELPMSRSYKDIVLKKLNNY